MDTAEYVVLQRLPTAQDYHDLRKVANLTPPPLDAAAKSLANTFACFLAFERAHMLNEATPAAGQAPVAMGRLLGDGALFLQVCDVAVHPTHQRKGLGKRIMKSLVDFVDEHAPNAYVSLVAEPLAQKLYPQFGFEDITPSIGMYRCRWIQDNPEFQKMRKEKAAAMMRPSS
jgi:ribosomal protein S18 acetylase RimI-like enzyme